MSCSARLKYGRPISMPTEILRDPKMESQANSHNFHLHQHVMFLQPDQKKWYPARVIELCKEPRINRFKINVSMNHEFSVLLQN